MSERRGLIGTIVAARAWSRRYPNGSLAVAGLAMILVPFLITLGGVFILELSLPEDPDQYFRIGKLDAGLIFSWWIIVMNGVTALTSIAGLLLLALASWRGFRDRRKRLVNAPATNPDAPFDSNRPP